MLELNGFIKSLATAIAITLGTYYLFQAKGITYQDAIKVGIVGLIVSAVIESGWPKGFLANNSIIVEVKNPETGLMTNNDNSKTIVPKVEVKVKSTDLQLALQDSFCFCGTLNKFCLNSTLDNHADNQVWQSLKHEHIRDLAGKFQSLVGADVANHLSKVLAEENKAFQEVISATLSENPNRIKEALKNLHLHGSEVADAFYQLSPTKLSAEEMKENVRKCNDLLVSMVFARLESNWLRDAKIYYQYHEHLTKMADQLSRVL